MHIDACIICVVADDGAAVYRQVSAHIDTCFIIARGGQAAVAADHDGAVQFRRYRLPDDHFLFILTAKSASFPFFFQ